MTKKLANDDNSVLEDYHHVKEAYKILGLFINDSQSVLEFIKNKHAADEIPAEVKTLAAERWSAKQSKDFAKADQLRQQILGLGYTIKDSKDGFEIIKN